MQTLAVLALILRIVLLFRWLGPPVRRPPEEKRSTAQHPEADIPPPDTPVIH
ncbi:MAG TPA: hypothetical protein VK897_22550 [Anaerolineales bacterium]|nr:hypothetical protein [Anaerolineales bacterium]